MATVITAARMWGAPPVVAVTRVAAATVAAVSLTAGAEMVTGVVVAAAVVETDTRKSLVGSQ
jgi:hypothetical protein